MSMKNEDRSSPGGDILIVDDNPVNLRLLSQMLSEQGYSVRAVTNGERALASVKAMPPDLILLDIRMPEMDGYQVCRRLKAEENSRDLPVIFISALSELSDKVEAFKVGGVDYITKPFQLEEVLVRTQTHLDLRALQKQLKDTNDKLAHELELAGEMQVSFMPRRLPAAPGWDFSAVLRPARETSGDFYDVFHLPDGNIGFLVADVVDKGVGAALFMALSWGLIRTHADEFPQQPNQVFSAVNRRILEDTSSRQFLTIFYGVLDPGRSELTYCNAGHMPPILFNTQDPHSFKFLERTGIPLGIFDEADWNCRRIKIDPGETLVVYTDGITDAENSQAEFFGDQRLLNILQNTQQTGAQAILSEILAGVRDFCAGMHWYDDITLIVMRRQLPD